MFVAKLITGAAETAVVTTPAVAPAVTSPSVAEVAGNFFKGLIDHPDQNLIALGYLSVPALAGIAGLIFLAKKGYSKAYPQFEVE